MTPIILTLPLRLESVANLREHWAKRAKRAKQHRGVVSMALRVQLPPSGPQSPIMGLQWPLEVVLTRIAPRALDSHDNLRSACKASADGIADALGIKDNDPRVTWRYGQEKPAKGTAKGQKYGLRVELRAMGG